jgi:hypothetical protein
MSSLLKLIDEPYVVLIAVQFAVPGARVIIAIASVGDSRPLFRCLRWKWQRRLSAMRKPRCIPSSELDDSG